MPLVKEDRSNGGPQGSGSDNLHRFGFRFRPIAITLNLLLVAAFALLQVWPLVAAYLGGIFLSAWMAIQGRKQRAVGGLNWMWLLVLSQSMFAVVMIGAAAGFQYYAITTLPIIFANELWSLSAKVLQSAIVALCLVLCVTYFADYRPFYLLTPAQIELWRAFNAVGTCTMLAALSANVYLTLKETQDSLAAANESLTLANEIQAQQKSVSVQHAHLADDQTSLQTRAFSTDRRKRHAARPEETRPLGRTSPSLASQRPKPTPILPARKSVAVVI